MIAGGPLAIEKDGSVLFSQAAPHRIVRYTPTGTLVKLVAEDKSVVPPIGDDFVVRKPDAISYKWFFPQSRAIIPLNDGRILNVVRLNDERASIWELYDQSGRLLIRQRVQKAYEAWGLAKDGMTVIASYLDPETGESVAALLAITIAQGP